MLPAGISDAESVSLQRTLLDCYKVTDGRDFITWYYTPMALRFSGHLQPAVTIYDCMDELSAFQGAPPEMVEQEQCLFAQADIVFCGGASLYASKRNQHGNVHLFPSSIDRHHFAKARIPQVDPVDQADIPHPRIGFYGVLDERLDQDLLREVARENPTWHFVLIGPVVKVRQEDLPSGSNIHYLGQKEYEHLPAYLANWDIAMLPFARNRSTRFISPTKTPEYLAGGKPVISTPIQDVVRPYGEAGHVRIATDPPDFAAAVRSILSAPKPGWLSRVDSMLVNMSWDKTFKAMWAEVVRCMESTDMTEGNTVGAGGSELNV
jgi:UDP-galactopyranose mutase